MWRQRRFGVILRELEEQHLLTSVHGGAVKFINLRKEPEYLRKMDMQKEAKREIAQVGCEAH